MKLWTYIRDKCANIGEKIENRMYIAREILKFTLFFEQTSYTGRKIVEVTLLNFRSKLGHMYKLDVI